MLTNHSLIVWLYPITFFCITFHLCCSQQHDKSLTAWCLAHADPSVHVPLLLQGCMLLLQA